MKLKAADGRHFLPILSKALETCFNVDTPHKRLRLSCIQSMVACYAELRNWKDGGESTRNLSMHGRQHLIMYAELSRDEDSPVPWVLYPKHHQFTHLVEHAQVNPFLEWNYGNESSIGEAVDVARQCNVLHLERTLLERHSVTFHL